MLAQVSTNEVIKFLPSPDQVAGWGPSQLIQWLLVVVLIGAAYAAYWGARALAKSNETVNVNYEKSIALWERRFEIQDERYDKQEARHAARDNQTNEVLKEIAVSMRSISDSYNNTRR